MDDREADHRGRQRIGKGSTSITLMKGFLRQRTSEGLRHISGSDEIYKVDNLVDFPSFNQINYLSTLEVL